MSDYIDFITDQDERRRAHALDKAIGLGLGTGRTAEDTVTRARKFEEYLKGEASE